MRPPTRNSNPDPKIMKYPSLAIASLAALALCSCDTYVTPENEGNLQPVANLGVKAAYTGKPAITFPANIALVRVQGSGNNRGYNVITTREIETEQDFHTISKIPGIGGLVSMNSLLLPDSASTDIDVRAAAAKLHANAILIYTVASDCHNNDVIPPLSLLTLGLAPNTSYKITSSASAILMDTKTGFIYGALEEKATRSGLTSPLGSDATMENARRDTERAAFEKLVASFEPFWKQVYARYAR